MIRLHAGRLLAYSLGALVVLTTGSLDAQSTDVVEIAGFPSCHDCIRLDSVVALGSSSPPGLIRHDETRIQYVPGLAGGAFAIWVRGTPGVDLFDTSGRFLREIAPAGEGPGESEALAAVRAQGSELVTWDDRQSRLTVFDLDSGDTTDHPVPMVGVTDLELLPDDRVALAAAFNSRAAAGFPLHIVALRNSSEITHTGAARSTWSSAEPWNRRIHTAVGPEGEVWIAKPARLEFDKWSDESGLTRATAGYPEWFPPVTQPGDPGDPPLTRIHDFSVDSQGRIWVLSKTADSRWRDGLGEHEEGGSSVIEDPVAYADVRLDVFDPSTRTHAGPIRFDRPYGQLFVAEGVPHIAQVQYDAALNPRLKVSRLSLESR